MYKLCISPIPSVFVYIYIIFIKKHSVDSVPEQEALVYPPSHIASNIPIMIWWTNPVAYRYMIRMCCLPGSCTVGRYMSPEFLLYAKVDRERSVKPLKAWSKENTLYTCIFTNWSSARWMEYMLMHKNEGGSYAIIHKIEWKARTPSFWGTYSPVVSGVVKTCWAHCLR
jgi:hypothetical protein